MKKLLLFTGLGICLTMNGQIEMSVFTSTGRAGASTTFVTDYQSTGINPANLGWKPRWEDKKITFSLLEGAYSLYSQPLTKPEVREAFTSILGGNNSQKFSWEKKEALAQAFTDATNAFNADIMALGFSIQTGKPGGFAISVKDRVQMYSVLNKNASEILFLGFIAPYFDQKYDSQGNNIVNNPNYNKDSVVLGISSNPQPYSKLFDGTKFRMNWVREFNFSYGKSIIDKDDFKLFAGFGLKYLQGIAYADVVAANNNLTAEMAYSPSLGFEFDSSVTAQNPSALPPANSFLPKGVGSGFGFDAGISIWLKNKIKLGLAVNDIGSITWNGNVYQANDDTLNSFDSPGARSYNVFGEAAKAFSGDFFKWKGAASTKTQLPTVLRAGAGYVIWKDDFPFIELGFDAVFPFNTNTQTLNNPVMAIGGDIYVLKWLRLSTGATIGTNYGTIIPAGLLIGLPSGSWEFGIASRDALSFFKDQGSTLSMSLGFLRFRF